MLDCMNYERKEVQKRNNENPKPKKEERNKEENLRVGKRETM